MAPRRYSVLLPTRNGGPFLDGCLRSVLELDRHDFEVVVADNANTDETVAVLGAYDTDPRLRVIRSERLLTVTENWRVALDASRGEYLLMIGDDDLVLPELFERLDDIIDRYDRPDCVTFNGTATSPPTRSAATLRVTTRRLTSITSPAFPRTACSRTQCAGRSSSGCTRSTSPSP